MICLAEGVQWTFERDEFDKLTRRQSRRHRLNRLVRATRLLFDTKDVQQPVQGR
jgi:hypothetical protein